MHSGLPIVVHGVEIVPQIQGSAWVTGEHTFLIDGDDPLKSGFRL